ncbi:PIN domain nuclease [Lachnoclostridium sp. An169]|uniref:type II toxin-antitoxin system VapC family toxin n=1 Tax=Lachnoclostridium sp. An169 TaxID=1965569 RepID=UPI000B3A757F|nr:type II toxin-antitoxin system VapC family toxin [Lachnoclostridium sp. An169]OUP83148.1 PIN domain nuclease [Lachnoclostridium sp. An169]
MKILLDTHIMLWALSGDSKLPEKAREMILDSRNDIYYSLASLWEIEIKHLSHPEALPITAKEVSGYCFQAGYQSLPVRETHIFALGSLSRAEGAPPHKDPFDRILICQALVDDMLFLTHDSLIPAYNEACIIAV